jgi:hypothetical protein
MSISDFIFFRGFVGMVPVFSDSSGIFIPEEISSENLQRFPGTLSNNTLDENLSNSISSSSAPNNFLGMTRDILINWVVGLGICVFVICVVTYNLIKQH